MMMVLLGIGNTPTQGCLPKHATCTATCSGLCRKGDQATALLLVGQRTDAATTREVETAVVVVVAAARPLLAAWRFHLPAKDRKRRRLWRSNAAGVAVVEAWVVEVPCRS